jgi:phosphopantetheinyl transferase
MVTNPSVAALSTRINVFGTNPPVVRLIAHAEAAHVDTHTLLATLQPPERIAVARYRDEQDRRAAGLRRLLVRLCVAELAGVAPRDLSVVSSRCARCARPHGKPRLDGAPLEISFSGTREYSAVAVHTAAIGIDIESQLDPVTVRELSAHVPDMDEGDPRAAAASWVKHEAAAKMTGVGVAEYVRAGVWPREARTQALSLPQPLVGAVAYQDPGDLRVPRPRQAVPDAVW